MRDEITEPLHWRNLAQRTNGRDLLWSQRRRSEQLAAEAVDAAFSDKLGVEAKPDPRELVSSLATQLEMLDRQREQLQKLLQQAQELD